MRERKSNMIRILLGGDICPMGNIQNAFIEGKAHQIFNDLLTDIANADLSIANLECPLITRETPIVKAGTILGASSKCIRGLTAASWDVLNLANNHIFDHGESGLRDTLQVIKQAGLSLLGAGLDIKEAKIPYVNEIKGRRIVIYSMAEHEYSIADEKTAGANPLDIINFVHAIHQYKQKGIFIVLMHGGRENYQYPSPEMVRRCRFMVDMGADAVICCHTHCPLPWEIYAERPIVYGLGNLIFESMGSVQDSWYEGYLAELTIDDKKVCLQVIPFFQSCVHAGAKKMDEKAGRCFFDEMKRKNTEVKDSEFLEEQWTKFCRQQKEQYLTELFGYNRLMRKARSLFLRALHSKKEVLNALLLARCETHKEILNTIFKVEKEEG